MKLFKKFLSTALSFGIIFSSVLPLRVFAEGNEETSRIPETLEECCLRLDEVCSPEVIDAIKTARSDYDLPCQLHLGIGLWIRNNWIYPCEKGRISELLHNNGCDSTDEISAIILGNYHHYLLTGESITNIKDFVIDYWFNFWHRFNNDLKREEIEETIEKKIKVRASRRQSACSIV